MGLEAFIKETMTIKYTATQQIVIDRYLEATKNSTESRLPIAQIIGLKRHIKRGKPDKHVLEQCEQAYLQEEPITAPGRKQRQIDNSAVSDVLSKYRSFEQCIKQFYWIDDIITGCSRFDLGNNTRPLSVSMLFHFISTSTIINTSIIMAYCDVKERQARNIMGALSVAHRMIEKDLIRLTLIA